MNVVGIDPGREGAIALLGDGDVIVQCYDMPAKLSLLAEVIREVPKGAYACIECPFTNTKGDANKALAVLVRKLPLLANYNQIIGMLTVAGIPCQSVSPKVWQATFAVRGKGKGSGNTIEQCLKVFPESKEIVLANGRKYDGRSDALLIAKWKSLQLTAQSV